MNNWTENGRGSEHFPKKDILIANRKIKKMVDATNHEGNANHANKRAD